MTHDERVAWLKTLAPYAVAAKKDWPGMRVSVCLAQAAWETGWGKKVIGGHNYWGIKDLSWNPGCVEVATHEYEGGKRVTQTAKFEDFDTPAEAFGCYGRLVNNGEHYAAARVQTTLRNYLHALACEWATDPQYEVNIWKLIQDYDLAHYDEPGAGYRPGAEFTL